MRFLSYSLSALGRLLIVVTLLVAFLVGMGGVVYMSLSGEEIKVPEIVGKDFVESERELAALGLRIKKRADRPSEEKINTVLEQLPRPGETVKPGQMILVVVAKAGEAGEIAPKYVIKELESDDTKKIEEMISDKPRRTRTPGNVNANANIDRKGVETSRDSAANTTPTASNTASSGNLPTRTDEPARRETQPPTGERPTREATPAPSPRSQPAPSKPAPDGETRPRTTPRP
jgi:beta-lactam-binding protein with PASTA domain